MLPPLSQWSPALRQRVALDADLLCKTAESSLKNNAGSVVAATDSAYQMGFIDFTAQQEVKFGTTGSPSQRLFEALYSRSAAETLCREFPELGVSSFAVSFHEDVDELRKMIATMGCAQAFRANLIQGEPPSQAVEEAARAYGMLQSRADNKVGY